MTGARTALRSRAATSDMSEQLCGALVHGIPFTQFTPLPPSHSSPMVGLDGPDHTVTQWCGKPPGKPKSDAQDTAVSDVLKIRLSAHVSAVLGARTARGRGH